MQSRAFYERLLSFRENGESDYRFSQRVGIKFTTLMSWKAGCLPRLKSVEDLAVKLGVRAGWLAFAEGKRHARA